MSESAKQRMPEEEALEASLHVYLKALSDRPVTPRHLVELERASKLTRQILGLSQGQITTGGFDGAGYIMSENMQVGQNVGYDAPLPLVQSSPAETFGASVVREFLASLKEIVRPSEPQAPAPFALHTQMSGADLVYAIAMAREKRMTDLEDKLTEKLLAMADKATDKTLNVSGQGGEETDGARCQSTAPCGWCDHTIIEHLLRNGELVCPDGTGVHVWKPKQAEVGAL